MNKLECFIESKRIIDRHYYSSSFDEFGFFITPHWHLKELTISIHGMEILNHMELNVRGGKLVLAGIEPTKEQQKIIDRINEIMKEEI